MIVKEINGKQRSFVFGTRTFKFIRELTGVSAIQEVFERLVNRRRADGEEFKEEPITGDIEHLEFIAVFFFSCAKTGAEISNEAIDFNLAQATSWIDEMGYAEAIGLMNQLVTVYTEKNQKALETGQAKEAA